MITWVDGSTPAVSAANLNSMVADEQTALYSEVALSTKTASYTLTATDKVVIFNAGGLTATLPDPTTCANRKYIIKSISSNPNQLAVVSAGTSKTIDGAASIKVPQYAVLTVVSDGTQWLVLSGQELIQTTTNNPTVIGAASGSAAVFTVTGGSSGPLLNLVNSNDKFTVDTGGSITKLGGQAAGLWANAFSTPESSITTGAGLFLAQGLVYAKANGSGNTGWHPIAFSTSVLTKTSNYTLGANDALVIGNAASLTFTLPDPTQSINNGRMYRIKNINSSALTVVSAGTSKTIDGASSQSVAQWARLLVVSDGTQWLSV